MLLSNLCQAPREYVIGIGMFGEVKSLEESMSYILTWVSITCKLEIQYKGKRLRQDE